MDKAVSPVDKATPVDPLAVTDTAGGARFTVKARPGARENRIRGLREGALVVAVTAVAEKGQANTAILKLLAKTLGCPRSALTVVAGNTHSLKSVLAEGLTSATVRDRLAAFLEP